VDDFPHSAATILFDFFQAWFPSTLGTPSSNCPGNIIGNAVFFMGGSSQGTPVFNHWIEAKELCRNLAKPEDSRSFTLLETNISYLGKRKNIFKTSFLRGYVSSLEGIDMFGRTQVII